MKLFHTADWHLGKLVQGVYMTEDQRYILEQFIEAIQLEKPDAVIIAGDLYDRAIPPTEAVDLLDEVLERIVVELETPVLAIAGNHDSPDRINFGTKMMESRGLYLAGGLRSDLKPIVISDGYGEVHFHLVPYADPAQIRHTLGDENIRTHEDAMKAVIDRIEVDLDPKARHVLVGHAFITPSGEARVNTSESERPLAIGGAEHVSAAHFKRFHYTALGHLHQAHFVLNDTIRYAGSPLKYSVSEENHVKGFYIVEMDSVGKISVEKRELTPLRDMRRLEATLEELEKHPINEDYVFVTLLSDHPVLFPMEKVRAVYPNAMHVDRREVSKQIKVGSDAENGDGPVQRRSEANPVQLFEAFYQEVKGTTLSEEKKVLFTEQYVALLREEGGNQ
ncbi:exonuclease SbcCD subunit D [Paenibacillus sp. GSMTC-2017]|uniref:exonuclease SbcCD subunit D n=1 Tax=Paenibacillus sp. GSMTC-2017 TaxID=2794350 RepID=UPI0018D8C4E3|nr:exonuclease SbcCD subunit D [Paenibacillus sp. GSMTC-2017]MBH5318548.1 exonuclease SbcCD subunit D [Paenibacillus sp. GSMTC-2017]